jgi:hypothetical protein
MCRFVYNNFLADCKLLKLLLKAICRPYRFLCIFYNYWKLWKTLLFCLSQMFSKALILSWKLIWVDTGFTPKAHFEKIFLVWPIKVVQTKFWNRR